MESEFNYWVHCEFKQGKIPATLETLVSNGLVNGEGFILNPDKKTIRDCLFNKTHTPDSFILRG